MDPCPFARILVGNLSLRLLLPSPPSSRCFCKIRLTGFPTQDSPIPLITTAPAAAAATNPTPSSVAASFDLNKSEIDKLIHPKQKKTPSIEISIHQARSSIWGSCSGGGSKFVGKISVPVPTPIPEIMEYLRRGEARGVLIHNGWVKLSAAAAGSEVFLTVRAEADPRFVFEFEKEPECSPQVFQLQGNVKQPVFTCKFGFRNNTDRNLTSCRSSLSETRTSRSWLSSSGGDKKQEQSRKERKGWSVTIHDLSGSPVAAASMVTPFVPSTGTDRVSRSNPGAWLILRPGHGTWNPWGRLEAWRETSASDAISYRFELLSDSSSSATDIATSSNLSIKSGGKFVIDTTSTLSPMTSPSSSMDFGSWSWSGSGGSGSDIGSGASPGGQLVNAGSGFVMSSTMQGVGSAISKARVEVGVHHVACAEDAAVFVALAAAMDLSMDACKLFSRKLRKELRQPSQDPII